MGDKGEGEKVVSDSRIVTKEDLIRNLWLTDEIINEIDIIDEEIKKKKLSLQGVQREAQAGYLKLIENDYYQSEEFKSKEEEGKLSQKLKKTHHIFLLSDVVISILLGYLFIALDVPFIQVVIFWLIVPIAVYGGYRLWQKNYLAKQKSQKPARELDEVLREARESEEFEQIPDSLLAIHMKQEIAKLNQKCVAREKELEEKTVLPSKYKLRAREIVWYLENMRADNLKEAIIALEEDAYRLKIENMIEIQTEEMYQLKTKLDYLIEENERLKKQQEQIAQQHMDLNKQKKRKG